MTFTVPTVAPIASGVRVSPAPRRLDTMMKSSALAGAAGMTIRRNRVPATTTASFTREAATSAGAHAITGSMMRTATAAPAPSDWRSVSSASARSPAPTWRATIASTPVPSANITVSTAPRICTPTPTPATAVGPRRPTISMSQSPTNDSIEKVKITGHASAHVVRRRSDPAAASAATAMGRDPTIPSVVLAPSIARAYHARRRRVNAHRSTSVTRGAYSSSHIDDSRLTRARGSGRRHSCRPPPLRGGDDDHRRGRTPRRVVARGRRQLGRGWWVADHVPGARLARPGADRGERDQHGVAVARLDRCAPRVSSRARRDSALDRLGDGPLFRRRNAMRGAYAPYVFRRLRRTGALSGSLRDDALRLLGTAARIGPSKTRRQPRWRAAVAARGRVPALPPAGIVVRRLLRRRDRNHDARRPRPRGLRGDPSDDRAAQLLRDSHQRRRSGVLHPLRRGPLDGRGRPDRWTDRRRARRCAYRAEFVGVDGSLGGRGDRRRDGVVAVPASGVNLNPRAGRRPDRDR